MTDDFYRKFEERHYAPRDTIKNLRKQYLPFVRPLATTYSGAPTFDLGCGRGEWLELMKELGFNPYGVDLDEGMLSECIKYDLPAEQGDAVEFLAGIPDNSQAVVSAFHVVEHISFEQLRTVVSEALRVLKSGGLLIMETPNPENIVVGTNNFYLDPTHQRPIPAQLLSFLTEYYGFEVTKVLRLQEPKNIGNKEQLSLMDIFAGVSPDYAVIAQKHASHELLKLTRAPFEIEYGVSLEGLASSYSQQFQAQTLTLETQFEGLRQQCELQAQALETQGQQFEAQALKIETQEQQYEAHAQTLEAQKQRFEAQSLKLEAQGHLLEKQSLILETQGQQFETQLRSVVEKKSQQKTELDEAREKIDVLETACHQWWSEADRMSKELQLIHGSTSWRLTSSLRRLKLMLKWLVFLPGRVVFRLGRGVKHFFRRLLLHAIAYVRLRPALKTSAAQVLRRFPKLDAKVRRLAYVNGLAGIAAPSINHRPVAVAADVEISETLPFASDEELSHYPSRTRHIYADLIASTARQKDTGNC